MSKVSSVLMVAGLAVLLSGCALERLGIGGTPTGPAQETSSGPFSGTLQAAVALGVPMKCTYQVEGMEAEGFIKGKQYRGSMVSADGAKGEVIMKNNCMWTWEQDKNEGFTMCFDPEEGKDIWDPEAWKEEGSQTEVTGPPPDMEYRCVPAVISDSQFEPPADVKFLDFDQMMQGVGQGEMPSDEEMDEMMEKVDQMMDSGEEE